ncbi:cell wall-binding repeat-containing protein [Ornithinimicrobium cavernae]|uniref:cell wall-binding repeat-containing protein n=1 Tax=Ornithinimicrobium cavernae TaxID=2666047 RepID=UPI00137A44A2|nr:cell wall-binding repeat-containing protein [Ornithinimicrobium cavernae]
MALSTRTARRGVAALVTVIVAATLATGSASTAPPPGGAASPDESRQAVSWAGGLAGEAPCPEGHSRNATLMTEGFGKGVPHAGFNNGWRLVTRGLVGAAARSEVNSGDSEDWFFTRWAQAPVGAHTMLAFLSRGNVQSSGYSRADVNSVSLQAAANTESWRGKVFDITAATKDESGRLGPWFQHRHQIGATQWWEVDNIQIYTCRRAAVSRVQGENRYDTSARIAAEFPAGQDVVYLANGTNFPDALAGAALAAKHEAPVLLVQQDRIPQPVAAQLDRLDPARIVVLGGTGAVGSAVVEQARTHATSGEVTRLAGENRYETSRAIADTYPTGISTVYVASGTAYPDALAGGAAAGRNDRPLLLTHPTQLPSATAAALDRLDPGRIVILGGSGAVSEAVARTLAQHTDGDVTRIAGADRYETAALIARTFPDHRSRVFVATGTDFPDALAGSAFAGGEHNPVLLAQPYRLPQSSRAAIASLDADSGVLIGGRASLGPIVLDQLGRYVG